MRGCAGHLIDPLPHEFNKFTITLAQMQDYIYHMILKSHLIRNFLIKVNVKISPLENATFYVRRRCIRYETYQGNLHTYS